MKSKTKTKAKLPDPSVLTLRVSDPDQWTVKGKRGRTEKLLPYKEAIRKARCSGRTYRQIHAFLKQNGIEVTYLTVTNFCHKHFRKKS